MLEEPFSEYFLCNFNDTVQTTEIKDEQLCQIWFSATGIWTVEQLKSIIEQWQAKKNNLKLTDSSLNEATQLLNELIQLTLAFVQNNFTGPFDKLEACNEMLNSLSLPFDPSEQLKASGEELNSNVRTVSFLCVAKEILTALSGAFPTSQVLWWWRMRLICLHQHMLDDLANDLYEQFKEAAAALRPQIQSFTNKELGALLLLELSHGYLQFHRSDLAAQALDEVCSHLGVELKVEGLLGVRTKFQQKPLPQLCLKVEQLEDSEKVVLQAAASSNSSTELPKLLLLDDDTRLERIRFIEPKDNEVMTLPSVLQALVLAKVKQLKRSQPKDRLADEELEPYTQTLLYQTHGPLQVRLASLLLNCQQESGQRRTVERSWKQCEVCVNLLDNTELYSLRERLSYGFAGCLQTKWQVQLQLVELLRSLGMTKTALDVCLQIQAWAQVIECYSSLELRHKAAEIIRQQLAKKPTALLYCLLGDAIDDPKCYEQAWEHSKQTSGKAQAYWGNYFYRRADYSAAIGHYEQSLEINLLQEGILLRCGYCAIQLERWDVAVRSYLAYTHLEPNGFESWNNLAKALIKLGDKQRAHRVLGEALKCNYGNWKVWENYMLVSVDTAHWEDAMRAYQRLVELKQRYLDVEVLTRIVYGIAKQLFDAPSPALLQRVIKLLGQQCVQFASDPLVWELAALVAPTPLKKAERLVKSYRAYTTKQQQWQTQPEHIEKALKLCIEIAELSLAAVGEHASDEGELSITSQLSSARLAATGCLSALKRVSNFELPEAQVEQCRQLEEELVPKLLATAQQRMQQKT